MSAQTHKATYSMKILSDPLSDNIQMADDINPLAENNEFYVYFDNEKFYYTSLNAENKNKDLSDAAAGTYSPAMYFFEPKKIKHQLSGHRDFVYISNDIPKWHITEESKEISGYTCIKAIGKIEDIIDPQKTFKVEVWFTMQIAHPIAPFLLVGLPGAVVYAVYENFVIFKLEKLNYNDNSINLNTIQFFGNEINKEEYIDYLLN